MLRDLESFPDSFTSHLELWSKMASISNMSEVSRRTTTAVNVGIVQVRICYGWQGAKTGSEVSAPEKTQQLDETLLQDMEIDSKDITGEYKSSIEEPSDDGLGLVNPFELRDEESDEDADESWTAGSALVSILGLVLSKEELKVVRRIKRLSAAYGQGVDLSHAQILAALYTLEQFYKVWQPKQRTGNIRYRPFHC